MKRILLRLGDEDDAQVSWCCHDDAISVHRGTLAEAAHSCQDAEVVVLVPACDVLLARAQVPGRNRKRAMQAVPYALEELLAADVENLHFALGPRNADGSVDVAVVDSECMDQWLAALHQAGIQADFMVCETLAVPLDYQGWSIVRDHDVAMVRSCDRRGFAVDAYNLEDALRAALKSAEDSSPQFVQVFSCGENEIPLDVDVDVRPVLSPRTVVEVFGQGVDTKHSINLLQGKYGRNNDWHKIREVWTVPLVLLLVFFLLKGILFGVEFGLAKRESLSLEEEIKNIYHATFPDAKQIVNPRRQMEQKLTRIKKERPGQGGFLELLGQIAPILQSSAECKLQRLRYQEGGVALSVKIVTIDALHALKEALETQEKLVVEIRSANVVDDHLLARLEVRGSK